MQTARKGDLVQHRQGKVVHLGRNMKRAWSRNGTREGRARWGHGGGTVGALLEQVGGRWGALLGQGGWWHCCGRVGTAIYLVCLLLWAAEECKVPACVIDHLRSTTGGCSREGGGGAWPWLLVSLEQNVVYGACIPSNVECTTTPLPLPAP